MNASCISCFNWAVAGRAVHRGGQYTNARLSAKNLPVARCMFLVLSVFGSAILAQVYSSILDKKASFTKVLAFIAQPESLLKLSLR